MDSHQIVQLLGILAIVLAAARLLGTAARWIGQPAVLGELLAGVILGASVLGFVDLSDHHRPQTAIFHFLQEIGVVILLVRDRAGNGLGATVAGRAHRRPRWRLSVSCSPLREDTLSAISSTRTISNVSWPAPR